MLAIVIFGLALGQIHPKDLIVTEQPSAPLHLTLGQKLIFSVSGNASTGANWTVKESGRPGLLFIDITALKQQQHNPPIVGQSSTILIRFKAAKKGSYNVKLIYGRTWELAKGAKPWDQRSAKVVVG